MNISDIKSILSGRNISAENINPMLSLLQEKDLSSLSKNEKEALRELVTSMLVLIQDPSSGAYLNDPKKAELLLSALD